MLKKFFYKEKKLKEDKMDSKAYQKHLDNLMIYNVKYNKLSEVKDLIFMGADVDAKDDEGVPVLALAAEKGLIKMTELLVKQGADLLETDSKGESVYDRVVKKTAKSMVVPQQANVFLYATLFYLKNVLEGQNRYNGKRHNVINDDFVYSVVQSRRLKYQAARVGDREHS